MSVPSANIEVCSKEMVYEEGGWVAQALVAAGGYVATTGVHIVKYFGSSKGASAIGIRQAWQGLGSGGVGRYWVVMGNRREGDGVFQYAGTETGDAQVVI